MADMEQFHVNHDDDDDDDEDDDDSEEEDDSEEDEDEDNEIHDEDGNEGERYGVENDEDDDDSSDGTSQDNHKDVSGAGGIDVDLDYGGGGSGEIPLATPYPWSGTDTEIIEKQELETTKLRTRQLSNTNKIGTGFRYLKEQLVGNPNKKNNSKKSRSTMSEGAQFLLNDLIEQYHPRVKRIRWPIIKGETEEDENCGSDDEGDSSNVKKGSKTNDWLGWGRQEEERNCSIGGEDENSSLLENKISITMSEEEQLLLAKQGKLSLFGNILNVIDQQPNNDAVTTRRLIRSCCLSVYPGDVPGCMDAKEIVLASLHFLSSSFGDIPSNNNTASITGNENNQPIIVLQIPSLPLIRPLQETPDLEKRSYEKAGEWDLSDIQFQKQLLQIERMFFSSSSTEGFLKRSRFSPHVLSEKDESLLLLKGTIPACAAGKKAKATGGGDTKAASRKRKAAEATTVTTTTAALASLDHHNNSTLGLDNATNNTGIISMHVMMDTEA